MIEHQNRQLPVVILGAGPAGLSAGVAFARQGCKVILVEKESHVGGLSTTIQQGPFRVDFGPHAFHLKNDSADEVFYEFSEGNYRDVYMHSSLRLHGTYFEAPLKFGQAFIRLKPSFTARMLTDYLMAQIRALRNHTPEDSFEAWGVKRYGRTMYEMAFGHYSRKVWGMPTTQLHVKLAQQKLPDLNFFELVRETLGGKGARQKILYSSYAYPKNGIGIVYENMARAIERTGGQILYGSEPVQFHWEGNRIRAVSVEGKSGMEQIPCHVVINTIPLAHFFKCCGTNAGENVLDASRKLVYRHFMMAFLEIDKPYVTNDIMIYLLDPDFAFNRISEQKVIAPEMMPRNRTVLCFEVCTDEASPFWNMADDEFIHAAKQELFRLKLAKSQDVLGGFVHRLTQAYPIYDLEFDKNLSQVLDALEQFENVYSIGRQGLFLNNDMHTSIKMGLEAASHYEQLRPRQDWTAWTRAQLDWRLE